MTGSPLPLIVSTAVANSGRSSPLAPFPSMQSTMSLNPSCKRSDACLGSSIIFLKSKREPPACKKSSSANLASFLNLLSGARLKTVLWIPPCKRSFASTSPSPPLFPLPIKIAMGASAFDCTNLNNARPASCINVYPLWMTSFSEGSLTVFFAKNPFDAASRLRMPSVERTGCKFKDWSERILIK